MPSAAKPRVCASNSISWPWLAYAISQNALEAHSASCTRRYTPAMTTPSSLQSNWKASPSANASGTNALVFNDWPSPWRQVRMKSVSRL